MCQGWTTEVHWQSGDSPKWFYCKRLTDGHTSYFPRTHLQWWARSAEKILVGIRPRSQLLVVAWRAGSREWIRFGKRRGRLVLDGGDAGAPIHNEFLWQSSGVLGTGGVQTRRRGDLAKTNDPPEKLLQSQLLRQQSIFDTIADFLLTS